ncbi:MAG: hypothetical protein P8X74_22585, partial [Reinekea sp.]
NHPFTIKRFNSTGLKGSACLEFGIFGFLIKKSGKHFKFRYSERYKNTGLGEFLTFFLKWVSG